MSKLSKLSDFIGTMLFVVVVFLSPLSLVGVVLFGLYWITPILFYIFVIPLSVALIIWYHQVLTFRLF